MPLPWKTKNRGNLRFTLFCDEQDKAPLNRSIIVTQPSAPGDGREAARSWAETLGIKGKSVLTEEAREKLKAIARSSALDPAQVAIRYQLARTTAETFSSAGTELLADGQIVGPDRAKGLSPGGNGSDEIVAVSLLLRVAGQLVSASTDLLDDGRHYAAASLLRQLVEVEYLAWAFDTRDSDAERWLRSTVDERRDFFAPAKLRKAAQGKFRSQDYGHHCEMGGHPVPSSAILLNGDKINCQLLLSDLLGHTGRIWDHLLHWSANQPWALPIHKRKETMFLAYVAWKKVDKLIELPPPP